ncbi:MAG: RsmF rRNA methyltransferase first C-terminal domain-containing protein [Lachnospiraceae bacterium]|nr:RsmF rRNA methyltransferase first C-terminal domain-containing protein [Lachnospiraceae bacterium]
MIMNLPEEFCARMKSVLGEEFDRFLASFEDERSYGLRINPLKVNIKDDKAVYSILTQPGIDIDPNVKIPWCDEGYYYSMDSCPGRSPFHEAGAYYIQEPSAMSVVTALDPKPGEKICDICAAPGGKTTQIAGRMMGEGILVSNEFVYERAKILSQNVERMGISNCVVTNNDPHEIAAVFPGYFDKVCVDAPCSGEGMFRKDDRAIEEWSEDNVKMCAERQRNILEEASKTVRPGGTLVYSTCTFEPEENEDTIIWFLQGHTDWTLADTGLEAYSLQDHGIGNEMNYTTRIWPHHSGGEGHFIAKLIRNFDEDHAGRATGQLNSDIKSSQIEYRSKKNNKRNMGSGKRETHKNDNKISLVSISGFIKELLAGKMPEEHSGVIYKRLTELNGKMITEKNDHIYLLPDGLNEYMLTRLKTIRPGLELAEKKKDRYEPAHALAMALKPSEALNCCNLSIVDAKRYISGNSITIKQNTCDFKRGQWALVTVNGISTGWGKYVDGVIKNHYPKGLRRLL